MFTKILKRDGRVVDFTKEKITCAIFKAARQVGGENYEIAENLSERVISYLFKHIKDEIPDVETVQDAVEKVLIEAGHAKTAKAYILYRSKRTRIREAKSELMDVVKDILAETSREDADSGNSPSAKMHQIASSASKHYYLNNVIPEEMSKAHIAGDIYIHGLDYYSKTLNCLQIDLTSLLTNGFNAGYSFIRPPKRIDSAAAQAAIILQSNQNDMFGGQSFPHFDKSMSDIIRKRCRDTDDNEIFEAMEGFVNNLNTMQSRTGAGLPFSSINLGTDITVEGRKVSEAILKIFDKGLGKGESPILPKLVFRLKKGINMNPEDPNYDLFQLAIKVASIRCNPTFSFMDASFNSRFGDETAYMGCRSRAIENRHGAEKSAGRGNIASVTINLPKLALRTRDIDTFFIELDNILNLCSRQLIHRFNVIASIKTRDMPFLMGQKLYMGSKNLRDQDEIRDAIKNGTLAIGFIGLAEMLLILTGKHHGEDEESWKLGYQIIEGIKKTADNYSEQYDLNFAAYAVPAKGLSRMFIEKDRKEFGVIEGVTDKMNYTNSFHIPDNYPISIFDKIEKEAPFHKLCAAGHISYVELRSSTNSNLQALEKVLKHMAKCDIGYGGINSSSIPI